MLTYTVNELRIWSNGKEDVMTFRTSSSSLQHLQESCDSKRPIMAAIRFLYYDVVIFRAFVCLRSVKDKIFLLYKHLCFATHMYIYCFQLKYYISMCRFDKYFFLIFGENPLFVNIELLCFLAEIFFEFCKYRHRD